MINARKATDEDCETIAPNLRKCDREEAEIHGTAATEALKYSLQVSEASFVLEADGQPFCLYGVGPRGDIWMVGTEDIKTYGRSVLRRSRIWLEELHQYHKVLWNWVDSRNEFHLKYLRWLGCKFTGREMKIGPNQIPFLEFYHLPCASH